MAMYPPHGPDLDFYHDSGRRLEGSPSRSGRKNIHRKDLNHNWALSPEQDQVRIINQYQPPQPISEDQEEPTQDQIDFFNKFQAKFASPDQTRQNSRYGTSKYTPYESPRSYNNTNRSISSTSSDWHENVSRRRGRRRLPGPNIQDRVTGRKRLDSPKPKEAVNRRGLAYAPKGNLTVENWHAPDPDHRLAERKKFVAPSSHFVVDPNSPQRRGQYSHAQKRYFTGNVDSAGKDYVHAKRKYIGHGNNNIFGDTFIGTPSKQPLGARKRRFNLNDEDELDSLARSTGVLRSGDGQRHWMNESELRD